MTKLIKLACYDILPLEEKATKKFNFFKIETIITPILEELLAGTLKEKSIDGLDPRAIIDASLVLTLRRPAKEDAQKSAKAIQSILDAVKSADTTIIDRKGNVIHESAIKETKETRIHYITPEFPDEAELEQEMRSYLSEV